MALSGNKLLEFHYCSGYSGEDGFEISVHAEDAMALAEQLAADDDVTLAGLGARDTLRLEAGLPLWGQEIDESINPIEAGLGFAISKERRLTADFPGAEVILKDLAQGPKRQLVGRGAATSSTKGCFDS